MKRKRFTEEEIIGILKESEAGAKNQELCRKHGISEQTFYRWRSKYGGMQVSEAEETQGTRGRESNVEAAIGRSPSG